SGKQLNMRIPGCYIFITDRPFQTVPVTRRRSKFKFAPALACSAPGKGFATHLVTPYPVKWLFLHIRVILILNKEMSCLFAETGSFTDQRIFFQVGFCYITPVLKFPGILKSGRIVLYVFNVSSPFQNQCSQSQFAQLLCCPSATYT